MGARDPNGMNLTVVGSGTAVPEPDRVCSGYFLETGDLRILLDCGSGVVHHLAAFALEWPRITHIALSHFHNDHIGDLPMLFFAFAYGMMPARREPLTIFGPAGLRDRVRRLATALGDHVSDPAFDVELVELASGEVTLAGGTTLSVQRTPHTEESIAYRIENDAVSVGYTGDTGYDEDLAAFLADVDLLVMECSLPEDYAIDTHLTPQRAARMAALAAPELLLLTHVFPILPRDQVPALVRAAGWRGATRMAADGLMLTLPDPVQQAAEAAEADAR